MYLKSSDVYFSALSAVQGWIDFLVLSLCGSISEGKSGRNFAASSAFDSGVFVLQVIEALTEQNRKLKEYVDHILVNVLERAPDLLEVKCKK